MLGGKKVGGGGGGSKYAFVGGRKLGGGPNMRSHLSSQPLRASLKIGCL